MNSPNQRQSNRIRGVPPQSLGIEIGHKDKAVLISESLVAKTRRLYPFLFLDHQEASSTRDNKKRNSASKRRSVTASRFPRVKSSIDVLSAVSNCAGMWEPLRRKLGSPAAITSAVVDAVELNYQAIKRTHNQYTLQAIIEMANGSSTELDTETEESFIGDSEEDSKVKGAFPDQQPNSSIQSEPTIDDFLDIDTRPGPSTAAEEVDFNLHTLADVTCLVSQVPDSRLTSIFALETFQTSKGSTSADATDSTAEVKANIMDSLPASSGAAPLQAELQDHIKQLPLLVKAVLAVALSE